MVHARLPQGVSSHTQTHTERLATKNIAISEEAYQRLKSLKRPGESFTDVIERMTRNRGVLELAGVLSASDAKRLSEVIRESREQSSLRLRRTIEKLS